MPIQPFTINVPQRTLDALHERLAQTRWPDPVAGYGWDAGASLAYLNELATYWRAGFDWRAQESHLNALPHYRTEVDGIGIHFVHVRGRGPRPLPLLLTHGWPSTFYEFNKLIPLLADPASHGGNPADAFDVVVPSLPGYGFSDRAPITGGTQRTPALWVRLMTEILGYERFAAHGTDIGAFVTNRLALDYPERLVGIHVTVPANPYVGPGAPTLTTRERAFLAERTRAEERSLAYAHLQRTRPQTLAYGLADSPVGLAAWLVEKWREWSDCGGHIERRFSKDELLTTLTLYWATETISSSFRFYYDWKLGLADADAFYPDAPSGVAAPLRPGERIAVPAAAARFGGGPPREWAERAYADLRRWTVMARGGHFAAMEEPGLLAEDLRAFFHTLRD